MDQQKRKELDDLKNELSEEHMDNAFLIVGGEVNGLRDKTGHDDMLVLSLTYAESGEAFAKSDLKKIKHFMPKYNAVSLAELMLEDCGGKKWVAPTGN